MLPQLWENELININCEVDWVYETAEQLIKDFNLLSIPLSLQPQAGQPYMQLYADTKALIKQLYEKDYQAFLNLLYRVDLNESKLAHLSSTHASDEFYDKIVESLLKREFMKVVYRHRYSL